MTPPQRPIRPGAGAAKPPPRPEPPPVYRPAPPRSVQRSAAPPVYRPAPPPAVQRSAAPPVYRPAWNAPALQLRKRDRSNSDPPRRSSRESTAKKSKISEQEARAGPAPVERQRRNSASYQNVIAYQAGPPPNQVLNNAIRDKKIWSGFRNRTMGKPGVGWETSFAATFWTSCQDPQGWCCSLQYDNCTQPDLEQSHVNLEIGHKEGFYTHIGKTVDTYTVCDGESHWRVMLYADVVRANQDEDNLHPQCGQCNRDPRQQRKDDRGGGSYQPEKVGDCPGEDCDVTSISSL